MGGRKIYGQIKADTRDTNLDNVVEVARQPSGRFSRSLCMGGKGKGWEGLKSRGEKYTRRERQGDTRGGGGGGGASSLKDPKEKQKKKRCG